MEDILADNGTKFVVAAIVVLFGLACLALVLWILRGRPSSPFIRGGRNRTPRLAVLDAAAVDTRRRLVLVRRDDVEHLVMIGGPTDIVIESRIVGTAAAEAPQPAPAAKAEEAPAPAPRSMAPAAPPERRPAPVPPEGVSAMGKVLYAAEDEAPRASAPRPASPPAAPPRPAEPPRAPESRAEAMLDQARQRVLATPQPAPAPRPAPVARPAASAAADSPAVVSEFEKLLEAEMSSAAAAGTVRAAPKPASAPPAGKSREEAEAEMARLLGEIAANRKS